ncbi:MAG: hypothetical protein Q8M76_12850, partial [Spirochaetaceae bacterium]|nr:hypothetical protein [Spirochaetaceae bacterium]
DGDGRFETERTYDKEGNLEFARIDADGDGLYEYFELFSFPFLKEWDFDDDGDEDARQYSLADGEVRREFSSGLDGSFDEAITLKDGEIISVTRDGTGLPLTADADPALLWIGRKPFDLGVARPREEGLFIRGDLRYRMILIGDRAFAEILP